MLTNNPNKSKSIELAWDRERKRKFRKLKNFMLSLPLSEVKTNVSAQEQAEINAFMSSLREEAVGVMLSTDWQNSYQTQAYERGIERADAQLKQALTAQEVASVGTLSMESAVLIQSAVHAAEIDFLHDRANVKLEKWIDELLFDTRSILHEQLGVVSVNEIQEAITERINATSSRARVIQVTEIAQASQRSVIKEGQQINAATDAEIEVMWITVKDSRVRHLHAGWHGTHMSVEQAARNITISPWNCRCGTRLVVKNRQPARITAIYAKERKSLLANQG